MLFRSLWVLTTSYNMYDQQGEYFVAAWLSKPSAEQIHAVADGARSRMREDVVEHILAGGGRRGGEYQWHTLHHVKQGQRLYEVSHG